VESLFDAIANYFSAVRDQDCALDNIEHIFAAADRYCEQGNEALNAVLQCVPELKREVRAMLVLSCLSVYLLNPIFALTDAVGTVMRKKIKHLTDPISEQLAVLQGKN
jgi:hypothetical protein